MPEDVLGSIRDIHRQHVVAAVKVCEIAPDTGLTDYVFGCSATDHEVGKSLERVLGDNVLDEETGAVATVGIATVRTTVRVRDYCIHI